MRIKAIRINGKRQLKTLYRLRQLLELKIRFSAIAISHPRLWVAYDSLIKKLNGRFKVARLSRRNAKSVQGIKSFRCVHV